MALSIDGSAVTGQISGAAASTVATSSGITTSNTNDIVLAFIATADGTNLRTVSSISGGGLTWAKRTNITGTTSVFNKGSVELWWALAASTLSSQTVTATLSGTCEAASITVFAISGANTSTPFDANAGLPATASNLTGTAGHPATTVSTSNADTVLVSVFGAPGQGDPTGITVPTSFTSVNYVDAFSGSPNFRSDMTFVVYRIVSATQSSLSLAWTGANIANWLAIGDAIQIAGAASVNQKVVSTAQAVKRASYW